MTRHLRYLLSFLLIIALTGCGFMGSSTASQPSSQQTAGTPTQATFPTTAPTNSSATVSPTEPTEPVDEILLLLSGMTLREKVGQLFIVAPEALETDEDQPTFSVTAMSDPIRQQLLLYPVGGIILFAENITDPAQLIAFNASWQEASNIPLFLCVDEEGGAVARLAKNKKFDLPQYKSAAAVGASGDPADGLEMGSTIGAYLKQYGFNLNFAPVADVNTNPKNTVIGSRAFSSNAEIAAIMVAAVAQGLRQEGIIPTFKHFPGHGDTAQDSHYGLATTDKTEAEMLSCEWLPFLQATEADCVMLGHIAAPQITGDMTPATLSRHMVTDILKGRLGFQGLVITDSLSMGAITKEYSSGEAALAALEAGCDLLLMPKNLGQAFEAVVNAMEEGTLTEEQLDAIVYRILVFKRLHGIL